MWTGRNISEVSKREKILRHLNLFPLKEKLTKEVGTKETNEIKAGIEERIKIRKGKRTNSK